jgi:deoxycytidylate deaminase
MISSAAGINSASANIQTELLSSPEDKDLVKKIRSSYTHEVVIGLCGPIGAPIRDVALRLEAILKTEYDYLPRLKKLSEFILSYPEKSVAPETAAARFKDLIKKGDALRDTFGHSILAELAMADISIRRVSLPNDAGEGLHQPQRFCHIIDSIKNEAELNAFKAVYGELFVSIGVFSTLAARKEMLKQRKVGEAELAELIDLESGEEKGPGQTVSGTFHKCDFFINCPTRDANAIDIKVRRICDLILETKIITPTVHETSMYTAFCASLNSACLSRQVGATVTDEEGNLLGIGWNDVPAFDGGVYGRSGEDRRCHTFGGFCYNDRQKDIMSAELVKGLKDRGVIEEKNIETALEIVKKSKIKQLTEFSRAVHAEMLALLNSGKGGGDRIKGGRIYVTTYPCHSCARHIVAAGIHEIHYIEPYRKSLAMELHGDALTEIEEKNKVRLIPFEGVSPTRYSDFFRMALRKENGKLKSVDPRHANFRAETSLRSLPMLEKLVVEKLVRQKLIHPKS